MRTYWPEPCCSTEILCLAPPAVKLFGRAVQDILPAHHRALSSDWTKTANQGSAKTTEEAVEYCNRGAHHLPDITVGSHVAIQNSETKQWDIYRRVVDVGLLRILYPAP